MTDSLVEEPIAYEDRIRRYPVPLVQESPGRWEALHCFSDEFEIVRIVLLEPVGKEEAIVTDASVQHPTVREGRSPFGVGPEIIGADIPCWLLGIHSRRAHLEEPFAEWHPGEIVSFRVRGEIESGALVCRRKGTR